MGNYKYIMKDRKSDNKKMKIVKILFIIFVIGIVIFAIYKMTVNNKIGQVEQTNSENRIVYQDNLRLGISNFDTINPILTQNKEMININKLIYDSLITVDSEYKINFCLATECAKTAPTTYIIKINNNIQWSNGLKLTTEDVKYTIGLLKSKENIYSKNVENILNVEVIDESTIKIITDKEISFFEYNLIFPIMCKDYYNDTTFFESNKYYIGTGRYKILSVSDNQIELEKNENYRDADKVNDNINKIVISIFSQIGEVYNSFKIGNIDIMNTSSLVYEDYIGTMGYYVKEYKGREYDFLSCNCKDNIMKEKSVRQAINLAIDKENIISTVYNNKYYNSDFMLDYGSYLYKNSNASIEFNPEKAKEILINDGWVYKNNKWSKNGSSLVINITTNSSNTKRCEVAKIIKAQLENIGIQVRINEVSDSIYVSYLNNKNYQILLTGVYNSYSPDLSYFYGENNIANYNNEEVAYIVNEVKNITEQKSLQEKYKKLIEISKEEVIYISLYRNRNSLLISQKVVGNFEPNNFSIFNNFETWNRE